MISIAVKYAYNKNGQITAVTRPDGLISFYEYDAIGRVSKVLMPNDTVDYIYDANKNNLTAVSNGESTISYTYDGSVLTKAQWSGAVNGSVGVRFNAKMQVDTQSVNDGHKIGFVYDNDGLLTKAGDLTIKRDGANGRLTGTTIGNLKDTLIFDATGNLVDYQVTNGATTLFREEGMSYDKLGRLTEKRETVDGISATYAYKYDAVGQLIEVRKDGLVVESYSYDANGNRLGGTVDGQDRMLSDGTATYTYTANGELRTKTVGAEVTSYEYDVQGNLIKTTLPNGTVLENVIDPSGRIISRKLNGAVVNNFLWESALRPAAMLDASGNITARFVYATGINVPDYMVKDGVTYRFVKDRLGSVRAVVDIATGNVVQKISYDSYGKVIENTNPDFQPFGFAGGLYESKTGLVRFGARDYDANSGRWTDKEPLGFAGDINFYRYAKNDPVNYIDPDGEFVIVAVPVATGAIIIADIITGGIIIGGGNYLYNKYIKPAVDEFAYDHLADGIGAICKTARDNSKGEAHGDNERALSKAEKQIEQLKNDMNNKPKKEQDKIKNKIKNIMETAKAKAKGETHWRK